MITENRGAGLEHYFGGFAGHAADEQDVRFGVRHWRPPLRNPYASLTYLDRSMNEHIRSLEKALSDFDDDSAS
jgi:hypothetical protein